MMRGGGPGANELRDHDAMVDHGMTGKYEAAQMSQPQPQTAESQNLIQKANGNGLLGGPEKSMESDQFSTVAGGSKNATSVTTNFNNELIQDQKDFDKTHNCSYPKNMLQN